MKTVDFKDGKFVVEKKVLTLNEANAETMEEIKKEAEVLDCSEAAVKKIALPKALETCVGVDGSLHIKIDANGWVAINRQQAAKLAYTLANFVES